MPVLGCPDTVCGGELATLTVSGCSFPDSLLRWSFSDTLLVLHGASVSRRFDNPGRVRVTLAAGPGPNCSSVAVMDTIWVNRIPYVDITQYGDSLYVQEYPEVGYVWTHNGAEVAHTSVCPIMGEGTYCCTVTGAVPPFCSESACFNIPSGPPNCIMMPTTHTLQCNTAAVTAYNPSGLQFSWSLSTTALGSHCTPSQLSDSTVATVNVPGFHYVYAYAEANGRCYKGRERVRIDCVPEIEVSYECGGHLTVRDVSQYRDNFPVPDRTITVSGTTLTATLHAPQMSVTLPTAALSEGTYTVCMSVSGTGCVCSKNIDYVGNPQITSMDIAGNMCAETPFLFSATANQYDLQYYWDFGDLSYNEGNDIYHTYRTDVAYPTRTITLIVTNPLGCADTSTQMVNVYSNVLGDPPMLSAYPFFSVCPGVPRSIRFNPYTNNATYFWSPQNLTYDNYQNNCNVYQTGDYRVEAFYPAYGCRAQAMCNVGFLTAPLARIVGGTEHCLGETVKLNGNTGVRNSYSWSVTGPSNYSYASSESNISFTPPQPGTYAVALDVNNGHCGATATCTVTVNPRPAAPAIAFCGNRCIHDAPVEVCSSSGQDLCWSNGYRGSTAYYYTPGYLTAHYVDPSTGCKSDDTQFFIEPAPRLLPRLLF